MNEQQRELSRIYQLSRLGFPRKLFIMTFLGELHRLLPSYSNSFVWLDDYNQLSHFFDERNNLQLSYALNEIENINLKNGINHWLMQLTDISESQDYFDEDPVLAIIFQRLLLPIRYLNCLFLPVRTANDEQCLGVLILNRKQRRHHFTTHEKALCQLVLPSLQYGLQHASSQSLAVTDGWHQGLLVVDQDARLHHACFEGKKLLSLAMQTRNNQTKTSIMDDRQIFAGIQHLIRQLQKTKEKQSLKHDTVMQTTSAWGEFRLTAFLIHDCEGQRSPQIGINICWQVPLLLRLFHSIPSLDLTPRQQDVALFYAAGYPTKIMADKLDLSLYTIKEHIRNIFDRLQIRSRSELIERLICHQTEKNISAAN